MYYLVTIILIICSFILGIKLGIKCALNDQEPVEIIVNLYDEDEKVEINIKNRGDKK